MTRKNLDWRDGLADVESVSVVPEALLVWTGTHVFKSVELCKTTVNPGETPEIVMLRFPDDSETAFKAGDCSTK
jgi:hypothetical protein